MHYYRIGLIGKAGSGKSTLAKYLETKYHCIRKSFAEPVYEIARLYFGMEGKDRTLLQQIGMKMREIDEDVWVRYLIKDLDNFKYSVVVDDVRFKNEAKKLKEKNFYMIRLYGRQLDLTKEQMKDLSEMELEKITYDFCLDTSKNIDETKMELNRVMEKIKEKKRQCQI